MTGVSSAWRGMAAPRARRPPGGSGQSRAGWRRGRVAWRGMAGQPEAAKRPPWVPSVARRPILNDPRRRDGWLPRQGQPPVAAAVGCRAFTAAAGPDDRASGKRSFTRSSVRALLDHTLDRLFVRLLARLRRGPASVRNVAGRAGRGPECRSSQVNEPAANGGRRSSGARQRSSMVSIASTGCTLGAAFTAASRIFTGIQLSLRCTC